MGGVGSGRPRTPPEIRFVKRYQEKESGCWEWTGDTDGSGYGRFWDGEQKTRAHRFSYTMFKGEIPSDMCVCHSCDNRRCVNPNHLWLGSHADNARDRDDKGRWGGGRPPTADRDYVVELINSGLSNKEIAGIVGVTVGRVSHIRNGRP